MIFLLKESRGPQGSPTDHRSESRLSIPRRVALQRSSSPLPQPSSILKRTVENIEKYSLNGKCLISRLSQLWGAPQTVQFAEITQRLLAWTIGRTHRFHQRPIVVVLAVFVAAVGTQEHSRPILS